MELADAVTFAKLAVTFAKLVTEPVPDAPVNAQAPLFVEAIARLIAEATALQGATHAFAVRRFDNPDAPTLLSIWPDVYGARWESSRWEQDSKIKHDYVPVRVVF